jgi:hypothetical protein
MTLSWMDGMTSNRKTLERILFVDTVLLAGWMVWTERLSPWLALTVAVAFVAVTYASRKPAQS